MMAIPHVGFILAAYAVTVVVVGGTAAAVLVEGRALRRSLARMESRRPRDGGPR